MAATQSNPTEPRKKPRQARSKAMVRAIIEATAEVLLKHGWARMNTNQVADAAGVSVGSLYQYFPNKESLVLTLARRHAEARAKQLAARLDQLDEDAPLDVAIEQLVAAVLQPYREHPKLAVHLIATMGMVAHDPVASRALDHASRAVLRPFLDRYADLLDDDLDTTTFLLWSFLDRAVQSLVCQSPERLADVGFEQHLVVTSCRLLGTPIPPS